MNLPFPSSVELQLGWLVHKAWAKTWTQIRYPRIRVRISKSNNLRRKVKLEEIFTSKSDKKEICVCHSRISIVA